MTPRAAAIGRKMHITVLVPNKKASSTRGASVSWTSQSGMTMLSRTWLVQSTPTKNVLVIQPKLRSGPGPGTLTLRSSGVRSSCEALGSRRIAAGVDHERDRGEPRERVQDRVGVEGQGDAADQRAEGEADVERGVHVGPGDHPLLGGSTSIV